MPEFFAKLPLILQIAADSAAVLTFFAGLLFYFTKRQKIGVLYKAIIGLRNQESFRELTRKLDHLERLNVERKEEQKEVVNLLGEVLGQLRVNPALNSVSTENQRRLNSILDGSVKATEAFKRQICSELREGLRGLSYDSIHTLAQKENHE